MQRRYRGGDMGLGGGDGSGGGRQTTDATIARGGVMAATFASLRYRNFTFLWLGQLTHAFALWIDQLAKPLFILHLGGTAADLGLILVARTVPAVLFGMLAGVIADNFNRRTVLILTKVGVFGLSVGFAAIVVLGIAEMWHIFAYNILRGMTMAFDQPARRAMIPSIVPTNLVTNAMALSTGSMTAMRIGGAAAAGLLVATFGFGVTYVVMTAIYFVALVFTWMLKPADHQRSGFQGVRRMGGDFLDGFKYAWRVPDIRGILIISLGWFMFGMAFMQIFAPLFAYDVLTVDRDGTGVNRLVNWLADPPGAVDRAEGEAGAGDNTGTEVVPAEGEADTDGDKPKPVKGAKLFGAMLSIAAVGSTFGALVLAWTNPSRFRGLIMLALLFVFGWLLITFSASTYLQSVPLALFILLFLGIGQSGFFPLINAVLVEKAHETMRGRVLGVLALDRAMTTAGGAAAGFLAYEMGAQTAQILFGAGLVVTALVMFTVYPPLRRID